MKLKTRLLPPHVEHEDFLEDGEKYNIFDTHIFFMNKDAEAHNNKVFHKQTQTQEHTKIPIKWKCCVFVVPRDVKHDISVTTMGYMEDHRAAHCFTTNVDKEEVE